MKKLILVSAIALLLISCKKEDPLTATQHSELCAAIIDSNGTAAQPLIDQMMQDLKPRPGQADGGHPETMDEFTSRLNECACLEASVSCYACILSLPPQSEISVTATNNDTSVTRILDIFNNEKDPPNFHRMHDPQ